MALSGKRDGLKHVPWFSLSEWHEVYKQIYSNNTAEQTKGYERLLVWKTRIPKLPVGVDCTLSIIQVCLRDRQMTPKIDSAELPTYFENDLCLMYSTTIMRFLNHISNIGHTKQSSLFQIAKQLKIPEWIVNLRHDAAHGHELPSISVLRIAANILLEWLHEEYWAAEAKAMEEYLTKQAEIVDDEAPEEVQILTDLIELWMAIGLYNHSGYSLVNDIPDVQLRETLQDLSTYTLNLSHHNGLGTENDADKEIHNEKDFVSDTNYELKKAQADLLSEISKYLSKNKSTLNKDEIVLNVLFEGDSFLPNQEFLDIFQKKESARDNFKESRIPLSMIHFWQELITLLHQKDILQKLILRLLKVVNDDREDERRRMMASLWMECIAHGLCRVKVAQQVRHRLEHVQESRKKKLSSLHLSFKVRDELNRDHPELKHVLELDVMGEIPNCLANMNFVTEVVLNANKFSTKFIPLLLELVSPSMNKDTKENLLTLVQVYVEGDSYVGDEVIQSQVYTIEDITNLSKAQNGGNRESEKRYLEEHITEVGDQTIRNSSWTLAPATYDWGSCPIGILPWQLDFMKTVDTFTTPSRFVSAASENEVVPGIVDSSNLTMRSRINWESVLGKKKRTKRKRQKGDVDDIVDRAIEAVRKQQ